MSFSFRLEQINKISIFYLEGEIIEKSAASDLVSKIEELLLSNDKKIILNLSALKYINSTGLSVIISLFTKCRNTNGELILAEESSKVKELMVVTKLNTIFTVKKTTQEAIKYFESSK